MPLKSHSAYFFASNHVHFVVLPPLVGHLLMLFLLYITYDGMGD